MFVLERKVSVLERNVFVLDKEVSQRMVFLLGGERCLC